MASDPEEHQLAAAEAGIANPAAADHKVQIRNALSLSPGLEEDVHSMVFLTSKHSFAQSVVSVGACMPPYCVVRHAAVPLVSLT